MSDVFSSLRRFFADSSGDPALHSLRFVQEHALALSVTRNLVDPPWRLQSMGVMLRVQLDGVEAFAATSDISRAGLHQALEQAKRLARAIGGQALLKLPDSGGDAIEASYASPQWRQPLPATAQWLELLREECARVPKDSRIVHWASSLRIVEQEQWYLDRHGREILRNHRLLYPELEVTAFDGQHSQQRTYSLGQQGGAEVVLGPHFVGRAAQVADEALQLLAAPNTPEGPRDLLLMPDQMTLQIHESIGHPLELDRILGDERNFAGTSFVTPEMFGSYRYGSELLNVSFDPGIPEELASYAYDDEGSPAQKQLLIRDGILQRPLGGALSQARSALPGVANSRACSWNRPPIDRMANLNVEPGDRTLDELVAGIEHGILMATNRSWSIDHVRNKFQFGCEWGQLIEHGRLTQVVKNPNYRGVSSAFWRNLSAVGDASTFQVLGTANCGKGEPNQVITVGHASPACVFSQVDVFGGQS